MKRFRFLLIAVAILGLSTFSACNGSGNDETNKDSTEVSSDEPTLEETPDSTATIDSLKK